MSMLHLTPKLLHEVSVYNEMTWNRWLLLRISNGLGYCSAVIGTRDRLLTLSPQAENIVVSITYDNAWCMCPCRDVNLKMVYSLLTVMDNHTTRERMTPFSRSCPTLEGGIEEPLQSIIRN